MISLPIDPLLPEIVASLRRTPSLVLEAPPGAGKTTRVPRAMLDAGMAQGGEIVVLQPRRLAARLAARRVAEELGENVGQTVGYQVRFEEAASAKTRVRFVTEGILTRRLLSDRTLTGVSAVLLDEFHERHLDGEVALALLRRLQRTARPDLRLVVMSATLEAAPVAGYLGGAPTLRAEGRRFDVAVEYLPRPDDRPLSQQVASALARLLSEGLDGDVLVFLPGAAEIRRAREACEPLAQRHDLLVLPLHGDLSPAEQDRAVRSADRRKVILSTNVAETSVTIEGVVAVIDSGLARIASHAPWSGLPVLRVGRISRASAIQRAGRAGRTRPGRCLRLYTKHDFDTRPDHEAPEIVRLDLAQTVLELLASGVDDLAGFEWFEAPPPGTVAAATTLLTRLGALDARGRVTDTGRAMLRFPVHPRQGRMILEAEARGVGEDGVVLAALLGEREIRARSMDPRGGPARRLERGGSDLLAALETFDEAEAAGFAPDRLRYMGLEPAAVMSVERVRRQLARMLDRTKSNPPTSPEAREAELGKAILAGYPDRVGRLRWPANATGRARGGAEIVFATGGTARLAETSVVHDAELVVAVDAEERSEGRGAQTIVRVASAIEPDWLLELFTDAIRDTTEVTFNPTTERVDVVRRMAYEGLVLEETPATSADPEAVSRVLADAVMARGLRHFVDGEALDRFLARVAFVRAHCPQVAMPAIDEAGLTALVREACRGMRTFHDVRNAGLMDAIAGQLTSAQSRALAELAPERVELPGGRRVKVEYPSGAPPYIESRLQDFFGMKQGPSVAGGRIPLVLHLLAPNQRAVQVTTDLAGFWERHYPTIARELRRKYPRHSWPDDPHTAQPPAVLGRRH
jgi:ATP-dependent helicase HrpB